jgi:hypothetical protein
MYHLKRAVDRDGMMLGSVAPIQSIRTDVQVTPHFGSGEADSRYQYWNSMAKSRRFNLNKYRDAELHYMFS